MQIIIDLIPVVPCKTYFWHKYYNNFRSRLFLNKNWFRGLWDQHRIRFLNKFTVSIFWLIILYIWREFGLNRFSGLEVGAGCIRTYRHTLVYRHYISETHFLSYRHISLLRHPNTDISNKTQKRFLYDNIILSLYYRICEKVKRNI